MSRADVGSGWYLVQDAEGVVEDRLKTCRHCWLGSLDFPLPEGCYFAVPVGNFQDGLADARNMIGGLSNAAGLAFDGISCIVDPTLPVNDIAGPGEVLFVFGPSKVLEEYVMDVTALRQFSQSNFTEVWKTLIEELNVEHEPVDDASEEESCGGIIEIPKIAALAEKFDGDLQLQMLSFMINCLAFVQKWGAVPFPDDLHCQLSLADNWSAFPVTKEAMYGCEVNLDFRMDESGNDRTGVGGGLTAVLRLTPEYYQSSGLRDHDQNLKGAAGKIFDLGIPGMGLDLLIFDLGILGMGRDDRGPIVVPEFCRRVVSGSWTLSPVGNRWDQPNVSHVDYHRTEDGTGDILEVVGTRDVILAYCREVHELRHFFDGASTRSELVLAFHRKLLGFIGKWGKGPVPDDIRFVQRRLEQTTYPSLNLGTELVPIVFDDTFIRYGKCMSESRVPFEPDNPHALYKVSRRFRSKDSNEFFELHSLSVPN
jgi:hypothetical protein